MTTSNRLNGLDHLRALAIVLVFIFHYGLLFPHPTWTVSVGSFGWTGVDLFFVLSGYLIASQLFAQMIRKDKISLKEFYFKRSFRIIPAYMATVIIYFNFPAFREKESLSPLWKFLTFTQNVGLDLRHYKTFSHAWSLCVEEQFYLLFPILIIIFAALGIGKKTSLVLMILFISGFIFRLLSWNSLVAPHQGTPDFYPLWVEWVYFPTYNRLDGILIGVSVAAVWNFLPEVKNFLERHARFFLRLGLVLIAGAYFLCKEQTTFHASLFGFPLIAIAFGFIVMTSLTPSCFLYKLNSKVTSNIATLSYSIYLIHKGMIHMTQEQFMKWNVPADSSWMFVLCVLTTMLGALALHHTVEKPFLKIRGRLKLKEN